MFFILYLFFSFSCLSGMELGPKHYVTIPFHVEQGSKATFDILVPEKFFEISQSYQQMIKSLEAGSNNSRTDFLQSKQSNFPSKQGYNPQYLLKLFNSIDYFQDQAENFKSVISINKEKYDYKYAYTVINNKLICESNTIENKIVKYCRDWTADDYLYTLLDFDYFDLQNKFILKLLANRIADAHIGLALRYPSNNFYINGDEKSDNVININENIDKHLVLKLLDDYCYSIEDCIKDNRIVCILHKNKMYHNCIQPKIVNDEYTRNLNAKVKKCGNDMNTIEKLYINAPLRSLKGLKDLMALFWTYLYKDNDPHGFCYDFTLIVRNTRLPLLNYTEIEDAMSALTIKFGKDTKYHHELINIKFIDNESLEYSIGNPKKHVFEQHYNCYTYDIVSKEPLKALVIPQSFNKEVASLKIGASPTENTQPEKRDVQNNGVQKFYSVYVRALFAWGNNFMKATFMTMWITLRKLWNFS